MRGEFLYTKPTPPVEPVIPTYSNFVIWAERSGDVLSNKYQWSFGDGGESKLGIPIPIKCELWALSVSVTGTGRVVVRCEFRSRPLATIVTIGRTVTLDATGSKKHNIVTYLPNAVPIASGLVCNFKTVTGTIASNSGLVTAWFRTLNN